MTNSISNFGINLIMSRGLLQQQSTLSLLSQQLASQLQHNNLTDYAPTDAHNILDFQNAVTQKQSYISSMQNVQSRISLYDTSMSDMENFATLANSLASQNQTFDPNKATGIAQQATNYLKQLTNDLNQQIGGRYIYAGTRYTKQPVVDLTTLTNPPTATTTTSPALPTYDVDYNGATTFSINNTPTGTFQIGNITIPWSQMGTGGTISSVTINGVPTALGTSVTIPPAATPTEYASNLAATLTQIAPQVPGSAGIGAITATSNGANVSVSFGASNPLQVTPDSAGTVGETTWQGGPVPDGTTPQTFASPSMVVNATPTGTFKIGNVSVAWSDILAGSVTSVDVGGTPQAVTVTGLSAGGTISDLTSNLASTLTQIAAQVPAGSNLAGMSATSIGANLNVSFGAGSPQPIIPDNGGANGQITWNQGSTPDGTVTQTPSSSTSAYTADSVLIDNNFSVTYGVSSDDPSFQKLVNGIRFITSAVAAGQGGDPATYQADMQQASTLISSALLGIQSLHAQVINNQNTLKTQTDNANAGITTLRNSLTDIQQVNLTQVGTELNLLQTQLQASYSSTASIEQLSLLKYL